MAEEKQESKPGLDFKKLLTLAFVAVNFIVTGGGAYMVYAGTLGHMTPAAMEEELFQELSEFRKTLEVEPVFYAMEPYSTNLDGLPRRFVRVEMSVEMYSKEGFEELVLLGGQSRDAILRILSSKKFDDVETVQGKLHLKNDIIAHLNDSLERGVVKNIYFTNFQVQ